MTDNPKIYTIKDIKAPAKEMLARRGVLLKLIFAIFLCVVLRMSAELASSGVYMLFCLFLPSAEPVAAIVIPPAIRIVYLFLMAPTVLGTYRLASMLAGGDDAPLTEIFYYFAPRAYFRALGAYVIVALPIELYITLAELAPIGIRFVGGLAGAEEGVIVIFELFALLILLGLAVALLVPYGRLFSVFATTVNGEGQPLSLCMRAATRATRGKSGMIFALRFSFIPLILLSVVTVGILFILFTLPYMLLSYFYCNAVLFGKDPRPQITEEVTFDER